jgi:ribosome maturation factor RimP
LLKEGIFDILMALGITMQKWADAHFFYYADFKQMIHEDLKDKIMQLIDSKQLTSNYEVDELNIFKQGKKWVISLLMDKKEGAISLDECADWNRSISNEIETRGWMEEPFVMEVASPGLDRPLKTASHFRRAVGESLDIHYRDEAGKAQQGSYDLKSLDGESLIFLNPKMNQDLTVSMDRMLSAKRILKFNRVRK